MDALKTALRQFLARRKRAARDARDLALLDRHADELNAEMADVLEYKAELPTENGRRPSL